MNIKPLGDRVILTPLEQESKTKSGIIIPDTAKEKSHKGKVLAIGEGRYEDGKLVPMIVKVDDEVIYREYAGDEIKVEGQTVIVVKQEDIIAIIE
jgi:chaperonin GroES